MGGDERVRGVASADGGGPRAGSTMVTVRRGIGWIFVEGLDDKRERHGDDHTALRLQAALSQSHCTLLNQACPVPRPRPHLHERRACEQGINRLGGGGGVGVEVTGPDPHRIKPQSLEGREERIARQTHGRVRGGGGSCLEVTQAESSETRETGRKRRLGTAERSREEEDRLPPAGELEAKQRIGLKWGRVGDRGLERGQAPYVRYALLVVLGEGVGDEGLEGRVELCLGVDIVEEVVVRRRHDDAARSGGGVGGLGLVELRVVEELMEALVEGNQCAVSDERRAQLGRRRGRAGDPPEAIQRLGKIQKPQLIDLLEERAESLLGFE
jgi:hypothetical protein